MKLKRFLGLLVAVFLIFVGVLGLAAPERLVSLFSFTLTPNGIYVAAGIRLAIGICLLIAAPASSFPKVLRVFGVLALLGGCATLFMGSERARMIASWAASQGTLLFRGLGLFVIVLGAFIGYAVSGKRR